MFKNVQLEHAHAILKAVFDLTAGKRAAAFFNGKKKKNTEQSKLLHSRRRQVVLAIGVGANCCC
jgi:hypothetical protein